MSDPPPWKDHDRSQAYCLNSSLRGFCATGDGPSDEHTNRAQIRDKIDDLPDRIQDLLDDVALLHFSEEIAVEEQYLDEQEPLKASHREKKAVNTESWRGLHTLSSSGSRFNTIAEYLAAHPQGPETVADRTPLFDYLQNSPRVESTIDDTADEVALGYDFGRLIHTFYQQADRGFRIGELTWGFLIGLLDGRHADKFAVHTPLSSFLASIETHREKHQENVRRSHENAARNQRQSIETWLTEHTDIEASADQLDHLVPLLERELTKRCAEDVQRKKERIRSMADDPSEAERKVFPDPERHHKPWYLITEDEFQEIIEPYQPTLRRLDDLRFELQADFDFLEKERDSHREFAGVDPLGVLDELRHRDTPQTAVEIKERRRFPVNMITATLNRLSNDPGSELLSHRPVFEETADGWTLTPYGYLLGRIDECNGDLDWVYWYVVNPDELTDATYGRIDTLLSDTLDPTETSSTDP